MSQPDQSDSWIKHHHFNIEFFVSKVYSIMSMTTVLVEQGDTPINKALLMINRAFGPHGFCLHFTFHPSFLFPTNQKLPTEYSAHGSNECLAYSQMTFFSRLKTFKQATSIYGKLLLCTSIVSIASTAD